MRSAPREGIQASIPDFDIAFQRIRLRVLTCRSVAESSVTPNVCVMPSPHHQPRPQSRAGHGINGNDESLDCFSEHRARLITVFFCLDTTHDGPSRQLPQLQIVPVSWSLSSEHLRFVVLLGQNFKPQHEICGHRMDPRSSDCRSARRERAPCARLTLQG